MQALSLKRMSQLRLAQRHVSRSMSSATHSEPSFSTSSSPPTTHFKITLRRSAIGLGDRIKGTLVSLGIHRRHQTVYHAHGPEVAGKLLAVKELIDVENVPTELVKTKEQQTRDRRPPRGYQVVGNRRNEPLIA
ncbi:hypothetical protein EYR36_008515 [Pleurotus pulmonarius]|nr:hypothetical protein EYR36_008515 [Pleurotus pulmonarius]